MDNSINHSEFIDGYKNKSLSILINRNKAADFVLSVFADKRNKSAHYFWSYAAILLVFFLPIVLLFVSWKYSIISFFVGLFVSSASRNSDEQFIVQNMLDNEDFFEYVLLHGGAKILNSKGEEMKSEFINKMQAQ